MKAYTDLEQSKRLSEILPIESADMCYRTVAYNPNDTHEYQPYCFVSTLESDIPCWSLAALLEVLNIPALTQNNDDDWDVVINYPKYPYEYIEIHGPNPVDACVEMILKLHKEKVL